LDAPAGQHGFLTTDEEGHFRFADGTPARFWGLNVASESVFQPRERIDAALEVIRRAGFNLVRIHHVDDTDRGLLGDPLGTHPTFRADRLERLDYWIARLKERGIYVYLDLLDYRTFSEAEGVDNAAALGRGAKPYAVFAPRLIELQQEYARKLLREHVNPYTGLAYADDPALALLELYDENGLFIKRALWPELAPPYREQLRRRWNDYLRQRHGSTARLRAAWTAEDGFCALRPEEALKAGSVQLPRFVLHTGPGEGRSDPLTAEARVNEAARFAYQVHRHYFRTMKTFLRDELGVRIPLTAVGAAEVLPDVKSGADELDFIGLNFYWDHPSFLPDQPWQRPFLFSNASPLREQSLETFAPATTLARVAGKPLVLREWNYCYPNEHRAAGLLEAVAYSGLQDLDALILFTFGLREDHPSIGCFDVRRDPLRWGLAALGTELFLGRAIAPARRRVEIGYEETDVFRFFDYRQPLYHLGWVSRVAHRFFRRTLRTSADLTVAAGRSAAGQYTGGRSVLFRQDEATDLYGHQAKESRPYFGYSLRRSTREAMAFTFAGFLYDPGTQRNVPAGPRFARRELLFSGYTPLGQSVDGAWAYGFQDRQGNFVLGTLPPAERLRAALDALRTLHGDPVGHAFVDQGLFVSDTGELQRDRTRGQLRVVTPTAWAIAGEFGAVNRAGPFTVVTPSPRGVVLALALDGQPLSTSQNFVLKMVTVARNTGQEWDPPQARGNPFPQWRLTTLGTLPIQTDGQPSPEPTLLEFNQERLLEIYLQNGTFELRREGPQWTFFCDTPGVKFIVPTAPADAAAHALRPDGSRQELPAGREQVYPASARAVIFVRSSS